MLALCHSSAPPLQFDTVHHRLGGLGLGLGLQFDTVHHPLPFHLSTIQATAAVTTLIEHGSRIVGNADSAVHMHTPVHI